MQKAETSLLPDQNPTEKPRIAKLMTISVDENQKVYVEWPSDKKELTVTALAEAMKLVALYELPEKAKPSIIDFVRGIKK